MLSEYFRDPRTLNRVRKCPSAPYLEGYADAMRAVGYAPTTVLRHLRTAVHLGTWTQQERNPISDLDEGAVETFRRHLPVCRCPGQRPRRSRDGFIAMMALRFLAHLRETDVVHSAAPKLESTDEPPLLAGFRAWMYQHRGARPATLSSYGRIIVDAIGELGDDPQQYNAAGLRMFVLDRSSRSKAKLVVTALRMFLRYLSASGMCRPGLDDALPIIARWRLAALPRYLSALELDRVIAACDPTTPLGSRNRAIILLLCRLGLRAEDVANLTFPDIDWEAATLCVSGKGRRATRLPLPQDVGEAILDYLRARRPQFPTNRVFLRGRAPLGPITSKAVSCLVHKVIRTAEIATPCRGAHVLRYTAAATMLRQGASLDQIRLVLRHRDPETTMHYAKVDFELLRMVAQPWPEVTP